MPTSLASFLSTHRPAARDLPEKLKALVLDIAGACDAIARTVNAAAIAGTMGSLDSENVQGEVQKKLDVISNDIMIEHTLDRGRVSALASEEMDTIVTPAAGVTDGYLLVFDPIDGSSNIDVNGIVGTIFSILPGPAGVVTEADFLQCGRNQVCAGYAIYGPQTLLILTFGDGVFQFALDAASRDWILTQERISLPAQTRAFAINMSYSRYWDAPIQRYIGECIAGKDGARGFDFNMRWMASMVGDVHRILLQGGIFLYPRDARPGTNSGKLRLLYEANPMAMLIEVAGGAAISETAAILDLMPTGLHQRTGVVLGSVDEVRRVADYMAAVKL